MRPYALSHSLPVLDSCSLIVALIKYAFVTSLESALTRPPRNCIKTCGFNPCRFHTYTTPSFNSFRIHTCKKQGVASDSCEPRFHPEAMESSALVTNHHSRFTGYKPRITGHQSRPCYTPSDGRGPQRKIVSCGRDGLHLSRLLCAHGALAEPLGHAHQGSVSFRQHDAAPHEGVRPALSRRGV